MAPASHKSARKTTATEGEQGCQRHRIGRSQHRTATRAPKAEPRSSLKQQAELLKTTDPHRAQHINNQVDDGYELAFQSPASREKKSPLSLKWGLGQKAVLQYA